MQASARLDPLLRPSLRQRNMFANPQNIIINDSTMVDVGRDYVTVCLLFHSSCLI